MHHRKFPGDSHRRVGIATQQRVEPCPRQSGVVVEADHVLCQRRERHLRLQYVLLRDFADGVLNASRLNRLPRDPHMLIVNLHLVFSQQQVVEGLVHAHPNLQSHLVKLRFGYGHIRLGDTRSQCPLPCSRKCLADAEHVLGVVQIPWLL